MPAVSRADTWPDLPLAAWSETYATLHLFTQIVGKMRLAQTPWVNHSWHVTLYVTARGLTTSPIPYGERTFQIEFDFVEHQLRVLSSEGGIGGFMLQPQSVAVFYARLVEEMAKLGLEVTICRKPNEVAEPIRFDQDETHKAYDREYVNRFWRILVQADRIFKQFRARFVGKSSPVHFFWGAPDLAVTRFSGRSAPQHPGGVPQSAGLGSSRGLLTRGEQLRILARRWADSVCGVLLLCLSGTGRVLGGGRQARLRVLQRRSARVHLALRRRASIAVAGRDVARLSADDLCSRGRPGQMGSRLARTSQRRLSLASR